ncbi:MAG TPA: metallothionein [Allocoleopsis sp.]
MATVTSMKCACESCLCIVSLSDAIENNQKYYCSEECSNGHSQGKGCHHTGCNCG